MSRAGRPQNPLPVDGGFATQISRMLRDLKDTCGKTFREISDDTEYSLTTLTAACRGDRIPSWGVTLAFVTACHGDEDAARDLYTRACEAEGREPPGPDVAATDPPDPAEAATSAEFVACMRQLRAWAGKPSLATLNTRSGGHLPPSTLSGALSKDTLPRLELVVHFLRACRLPEDTATVWEAVWRAIKSPGEALAGNPGGPANHPNGQSDARVRRSPSSMMPPASLTVTLIIIAGLLAVFRLHIVNLAGLLPPPGPGITQQAAIFPLQIPGETHVLQGGLRHGDLRAIAFSIARIHAETQHVTRKIITTGQVAIVSNFLGPEWGDRNAYLTAALEMTGSGTAGTPVLTLGGLPDGTAIGLLSGGGRSIGNCATAQWYIASSMPLIPDSTICIFQPGKPGLASLLSIQQRSSHAIALDITAWCPVPQQAGTHQQLAFAGDLTGPGHP